MHIFEPRYRQMVKDAASRDNFIALALPNRVDESDVGLSPVHSIACLGTMQKLHEFPDGRYLLQLYGLERVRIMRELTTGSPYREAFVELLPDQVSPIDAIGLEGLLTENLAAFNSVIGKIADLPGEVVQTKRKASIGRCLDTIAYYLPTDSSLKQKLLEELQVYRRGQLLLTILHELATMVAPTHNPVRLFPKPSRN